MFISLIKKIQEYHGVNFGKRKHARDVLQRRSSFTNYMYNYMEELLQEDNIFGKTKYPSIKFMGESWEEISKQVKDMCKLTKIPKPNNRTIQTKNSSHQNDSILRRVKTIKMEALTLEKTNQYIKESKPSINIGIVRKQIQISHSPIKVIQVAKGLKMRAEILRKESFQDKREQCQGKIGEIYSRVPRALTIPSPSPSYEKARKKNYFQVVLNPIVLNQIIFETKLPKINLISRDLNKVFPVKVKEYNFKDRKQINTQNFYLKYGDHSKNYQRINFQQFGPNNIKNITISKENLQRGKRNKISSLPHKKSIHSHYTLLKKSGGDMQKMIKDVCDLKIRSYSMPLSSQESEKSRKAVLLRQKQKENIRSQIKKLKISMKNNVRTLKIFRN